MNTHCLPPAFSNLGVVITAAGNGTRYGSKENKIFDSLHGIPIIVHTLRFFQPISSNIVITARKQDINQIIELLDTHQINARVVVGGNTRLASVQNGLRLIKHLPGALVHDAARPNPTHPVIERVLRAAIHHDCVIPAILMTDTIKQVNENGYVVCTLQRSTLRAIQTPQYFSSQLVNDIINENPDLEITDESMIVEKLKKPVFIVDGANENIKLTVSSDLAVLTNLIQPDKSEKKDSD